ncbi:hypothetical protein BU16DRAFT_270137 [Lophium mytilinum]|uniref:Uncharacterized protein n=1 Tax=Lophium mytilinum TaxID=390894 RepID=A0A6A6R4M7_9PEZI|nr:hypothetical protein BU16DRAFT_270137 [Lophium mytilinum]
MPFRFHTLLLGGLPIQIDLVSPAFECRWVIFFSFLFFLYSFTKASYPFGHYVSDEHALFRRHLEGYTSKSGPFFGRRGGGGLYRTCMAFTVGVRPSGAPSTGSAMEKVCGLRLFFHGNWGNGGPQLVAEGFGPLSTRSGQR